jgi:hypothetical protein
MPAGRGGRFVTAEMKFDPQHHYRLPVASKNRLIHSGPVGISAHYYQSA